MRRLTSSIIVLALWACGVGFVWGQPADAPTLDPTKALTQYIHETWERDDGLPHNTVNAITQTPDGYLWLGTEGGLVRFNGHDFKIFDRANTDAFSASHHIRRLAVDSHGQLWIGTVGGGVVRHADGQFMRYTPEQGLAGQHVGTLYADSSALWVGTFDKGLFRIQGGEVTTPSWELPSTMVTAVLHATDGTLWVGTDMGLSRIRDGQVKTFTADDGLPGSFVVRLHEDPSGRIWASTRSGMARFAPDGTLQSDALSPELQRTTAFAFWTDTEKTLWLGTDGQGLVRVQKGNTEAITTKTGLASNRVVALFQDREGSLWFGAEGGGLNRLRNGKFTPLGTPEGLNSDMALSVYEDSDGALWVGTEGGGVNRIHEGAVTSFTTDDGLSSNVVLSIQEDAEGTLWIGTYGGGVNRFEDGRFTSYTAENGFLSNAVFALHRGPSGILWMGTDAGVARYAEGDFSYITADDGLSSNLISTLHEDRSGALWVGTFPSGLNRVRGDSITLYGRDEGLPESVVTAIHEDSTGTLWLGTRGGGLVRFKDGTFEAVTSRDGLFSDNIYQILADDRGYFWMGSGQGIFRVRRAALNDVLAGRAESVSSDVFSEKDGLRSSEISGGVQPPGWTRSDGTLWFPTGDGIAGIDPAHIQRNAIPPPIRIESIKVEGSPTARAGTAELEPGTKKVEFHFAALTFIAPDEVTYQYKLEGYDTSWSAPSSGRVATYTNLDPGTYTFRVRARNADGVMSRRSAAFTFRQAPFFYETSWFWMLCVLGMVALGGAGYHLRMRQLKARQEELERLVDERTRDLREAKDHIETQAEELRELDRFKTRFFANISHEFRTPLTLMMGPLQNALSGAFGSLNDELRNQVEIMLRNALRLRRLIDQLLDLSKLEAGKMYLRARANDLIPFLEGITFSFAGYAEQKNIDLQFASDVDAVELYYEPDKLEKAVFNLLSNAIKFTPEGGDITVEVTEHGPDSEREAPEGYVTVRVTDTGPGIPEDRLAHIFDRFRQADDSNTREHEGTGIGLALVKEIVLLHGGTIEVESEEGEGTKFTITLLKGSEHLDAAVEESPVPEDEETDSLSGPATELAAAHLNAMERTNGEDDADAIPEAGDPEEADPEEADLEAGETSPEAPDTAPLVLVVDDNADIRDYVRSCLHPTYRVATAVDGEEGLDKAAELTPELIILDIMMPKLDGYAVCERIKSDPDLRHIPVILLSAKTSQETIIRGLEHGADEYVAKPFNARELHARIDNLMTLREQERELKELNEHLEEKVEEQIQKRLSERKTYEAKLRAEKERAEKAARLKSAILNNMSHEFRTPMTGILGYTEILLEETDEEYAEFAQYIYKNGKRLMETLNAVLDLSQLEAAALDPEKEVLDVTRSIRQAVDEIEPKARRNDLTLQCDLPDTELTARFDSSALDRVLGILLDNAVKFTPDGTVDVTAGKSGEGVYISVRDTGVGISDEFMPKLFEPFHQESMGDARDFEGNGLSLSIAKRLVDLSGGTIEVESEKGKGSVFTIYLSPVGPKVHGDGVAASDMQIHPG